MSLVSRCAILILTVLIRPVSGQTAPDFDRDVAPVLLSRCLECHRKANPSGGLSLETAADQRRGGDSGPALIPGNAPSSLLLTRVLAAEMPPPMNGHDRPLPQPEMDVLRRWIDAGPSFPTAGCLICSKKL